MTTGSGAPGDGTCAKSFTSPLVRSAVSACACAVHAQTAATRARVRMVRRIPADRMPSVPTKPPYRGSSWDASLRGGRFRLGQLPCRKPFVRAAGFDEILVRAPLDDPAVTQDHDLVRIADR